MEIPFRRQHDSSASYYTAQFEKEKNAKKNLSEKLNLYFSSRVSVGRASRGRRD